MIQEILNKWLLNVKKDLIINYDKLGLRASGKWANTLEEFIEIKEGTIRTGISGQKYTGALENGRDATIATTPSSPTLQDVIRIWIDEKPIIPKDNISKDSLAFLIARKIHKEGIEVPNIKNKGGLVSNIVTKERIRELNKELTFFYVNDFKSNIIKDIKL